MEIVVIGQWVGLTVGIVTLLGIAVQVGRLLSKVDGINTRLDHMNGSIGDAHHRIDEHLEANANPTR